MKKWLTYRSWLQRIFLLWGIGIWRLNQGLAQCSQCKAAAASEGAEGEVAIFSSINIGILYLLVLPVGLPIIVGLVWWWKMRKGEKQPA